MSSDVSGGGGHAPAPIRRDNLPSQPTRLIGRERDVAALSARLRDGERLITLTGPGGAGKTRLGIAVAAASLDAVDAGAWLVELGAISSPDEVGPAIIAVLDDAGASHRPPVPAVGGTPERVAAWLAGRRGLLVLDNFEQLPGAAPLVAALLAAAPGLSIVVTSRILLGAPGEREWPVAPLATPGPGERDPGVIAAAPAVRLFVERARAAAPGFRLEGDRVEEVAAICRHLDGLPLAIELAAARTRILPPAAILARLDERIALLSGGPRDLPGRHQSIDAAIAWSDDLLDLPERAVFRRLSVFRAPWTAGSAAEVAGARESNLEHLADHSLLRRETGPDGETRYRMLETVRAFAGERLAEDPAALATVRDRHARWFEQVVADHENRAAAVNRGGLFDRHLEDILAAIAWRDRTGRPADSLQMAIRLGWYWYLRGRVPLGARLLAGVEDDAGLPPAARAAGLSLLGLLRISSGEFDGAARALDAAEVIHRSIGDEAGELEVREHRADLAMQRGDLAAARALREDLLACRRAAGEAVAVASAMNNLAEVEQLDGADGRALDLLSGALELCGAAPAPDRLTRALIQGNLASLGAAMALAGSPAAPAPAAIRANCRESLRYSREAGDAYGVMVGLLTAAMLAAPREPASAARLVAGADAVSARAGIAISGVEALRRSLAAATIGVAHVADPAAEALDEEAAVRLALAIAG